MRSFHAEGRERTRATRTRRDKEPLSSWSVPAQGPSQLSLPICRFDVVQYVPGEKPYTKPKLSYLSLSSDLRLLLVRQNDEPPSSLLSFRSPKVRLELTRMKDVPHGMDLIQTPLQEIVASRVAPCVHQCGPAVRLSEGRKIIQLVAKDEEERDRWMSALILRLAPVNAMRHRFREEMKLVETSSKGGLSVAQAAKEVVRLDTESKNGSGAKDEKKISLAKRLWTTLGMSAQSLNWTSSFGQAIAGSAEEVEKLAKPFCQIGIVGCAFSLISLSARAAHLLATERDGMGKLEAARKTLRDASLALCEWLMQILRTGFQEEALIALVFDVMEDCWAAAARVEQYVLLRRASRVWKADEVKEIEENVDVLRRQLLSVGVLKFVSIELEDMKQRVNFLEDEADATEVFVPFLPDPVRYSKGLLSDAAKTTVDRLKKRILIQSASTSSASDVESEGNRVCRVALTSMSGEGGVGKTSACKLLCADPDVQNYFSGGAILWISLGFGVSDEKVKERIGSIVADCGGYRTAKSIRRAASVHTAVDYARQFFKSHCILLVIDNVWKPANESDVTDWMAAVSRIATYRGSVVLMTTRFRDLCLGRGMDHVPLGRLNLDDEDDADWKIAEALYDRHMWEEGSSSGREEQSDDYQLTRTKALRISCGLPLAIASICGLIRLRENSAEAILALIMRVEKEGGLARKSFGKETESVVGHAGLYAAMSESLEFLDRSEQGDEVFKGCHRDANDRRSNKKLSATYLQFETKPVSTRYAALEAMDKSSGRSSFSTLAALWHMESADDAEELCLMFANVGLGRIERNGECGEEDFFVLHDLQYDFCRAAARKYCVNGHLFLLSGCMPFLGKEHCWNSFCFSRERSVGYGSQVDAVKLSLRLHMGQHLFHHLSEASVAADECTATEIVELMIDLLTDFCWLRGRGQTDGRAGVVADFRLTLSTFIGSPCGVSCCTCDKHGVISVDTREAILLIRRVIELAPEYEFWNTPTTDEGANSKNATTWLVEGYFDGPLASSIVGQLHEAMNDGWNTQVDVMYIQKLISSTEENVRSPWVRSRVGSCRYIPLDKRFLTDMTVGNGKHPVSSVSSLGDGSHVVSLCAGVVRIHNISTVQTVLALGNGEVVCTAACESSGEGIFLVFSGGCDVCVTIVRKDIKGNIHEHGKCTLHSQAVSQMAVSRNGSRLAAVFSDTNNVAVWNRSGDDITVCYTTLGSFRCDQRPSNIAMSAEGDVIVSNAEKEIVVWRMNTETCSFKNDLQFSTKDKISSIVFSEDAKSLIVGTQNGCLEIWSLSSKCLIKRIEITCRQLHCLTFLPRTYPDESCETVDDLLVVGNRSSVKVFNFSDLRILHEWPVQSVLHSVCVLKTSERNLLVTGCLAGSLSVKDVTDFNVPDFVQEYRFQGPQSVVECISIVPKHGIVLSGHQNGLVCTWDFESGNFVRSFEGKHDMHVTCIHVSDDEDIAVSGSWDGSVKVWEISSSTFRLTLEGMSGPIASVLITPTNRSIISCTVKICMRVEHENTGDPAFSMLLEKRETEVKLGRSGKGKNWIAGRCNSKLISAHSGNVRGLSAWKNGLPSLAWETVFSNQGTSDVTNIALWLKMMREAPEKQLITKANRWVVWKQEGILLVCQLAVDGDPRMTWPIAFHTSIGDCEILLKPYMSHSETLVVALSVAEHSVPTIMHFVPKKGSNGGV